MGAAEDDDDQERRPKAATTGSTHALDDADDVRLP